LGFRITEGIVMDRKQKLELTWIGKYDEIKVEPRILLEDKSKGYGDQNTENMLIHGDNLLALKALEQDFAGKIQCIYIDPPFNTGARINSDGEEVGYEDGIEHSEWLNMMSNRLKLLKSLLKDGGTIVIHLDDNEMAYCKILLDEIFGRQNYINTITMTTNDPSGFKATGVKIFSTSNYLLVYSKNKKEVKINKIYKRKEYDTAYSKIFTYMNGNYKKWKWMSLKEFICQEEKYSNVREMKKDLGEDRFNKLLGEYAVKYADRVFRTAAIGGGAKKKRQITIDLSKKNRNEIFVHEGEDIDNFYILNGEQILFYKDRLAFVDGQLVPAEVITDVWTDISWTGIANEGGVVFKNGKKPELLIKRILELFTNENDIVLDSFLGSGTTAAVAHKMNRKWIGIEMGPHCYTHCLPRLKAVVDGEQSGISKAVNWNGGGGFRFFELAPSLLKKDKYGNWVIDERYNADMLAAAMAKHQGFTYSPDSEVFWKQGYSFEKDYIFTTTQFVTLEYLDLIHQEMAGDESLLICCKAFQDGADQRYENINVKKIPQVLLNKCDFGVESYSLNIVGLPEIDEEVDDNE